MWYWVGCGLSRSIRSLEEADSGVLWVVLILSGLRTLSETKISGDIYIQSVRLSLAPTTIGDPRRGLGVEVKFLDVTNNLPPKSKEVDGVVGLCVENVGVNRGLVSKMLAMREGKDRL